MTNKFNPLKEFQNFIIKREEYLKSKTAKLHYYTEKYNFPFAVDLVKNLTNDNNCTFILVNNFDEYQSLFSDLNLYNQELALERLRVEFVQFENQNPLPFYVKLCCQNLN